MDKNEIQKKVADNQRITEAEGLWLLQNSDLFYLGELAEIRRQFWSRDNAFYQFNFNINHTNICENECDLCAFYKDEKNGYTMTLSEIEKAIKKVTEVGVNEVHIVGGLNKHIEFDYFVEMLKIIKSINSAIHIQAFTPVEIDYFARKSGLSTLDVLRKLKAVGLDTLPGGGAEIFSQRVRDKICKNKISGAEWLKIMEEAHSLGVYSNATMLYGHIETDEEIIDHMSQLRNLQDRTNGFLAFVPLAFFPENTKVEKFECMKTQGVFDMKLMALSRIFLDNFPHLKSLWMIYGYKACQVGLDFGADDIGGTYFDEHIVHSAGAKTPRSVTEPEICDLILKMGRKPVQVNSKYEPVKVKAGAV